MRDARHAAARRGRDLLTGPTAPADVPAVSITSYVVSAGKVDAFTAWAGRLRSAAADQPGFLDTLRLDQTGGVFHLVQRFASREQLDAWAASPAHRALAAEAERFSQSRQQVGEGHDIRLSLPGEADAAKWKKFLMTWAAVFPVLLVLNLAVGLTDLPQVARLLITSPMLTAILTWVILPKVTRWLKPWVLSDAQGRPRKPGK